MAYSDDTVDKQSSPAEGGPAAEHAPPTPEAAAEGWWDYLPNVRLRTLGGWQLWGDVAYFRGWRIQHNVVTGHYRLLDPENVRHAWGSHDACLRKLQRIKQERNLPEMSGAAVVVVHGIIRSSRSFNQMRDVLEEAGYTVVCFDYPSTRVSMSKSAGFLQQVLESLEGIEEIHFVVHSMGGLLVRTYLADVDKPDPRIGRMVMLGVPNRGAQMANIARSVTLYKWLFGPAGQQLVEDPDGYIARLPTPPFEFGIISGVRGTDDGWNPLIPGDDDGTVTVASTRLPGAADFMTTSGLHSFLMNQDDVIDATVRFLATGAFRESGERQPIPATSGEDSRP